ncbi:hypothetical protein NDU88_000252 [Pleurodeles waltl]|uniref:Uncharacterized protein n=1 Tax=Pleurodeles waltl TaxID=8319 RepID=A0AAV7P0C0_PLEWA|nr:hypothetical protein NDU88_000252 [Pleurodeles waltl]
MRSPRPCLRPAHAQSAPGECVSSRAPASGRSAPVAAARRSRGRAWAEEREKVRHVRGRCSARPPPERGS